MAHQRQAQHVQQHQVARSELLGMVRSDRKLSPMPAMTACLMVSLLGISITMRGWISFSANRIALHQFLA
jgi:hypothetical protein